jgi:hypothetical protein
LAFFKCPSHVLFTYLANIRYDSEPDTAVAQLLEHGRDLRVNIQSLESMGLLGGKANGPEGVPDIEESRMCGLDIHHSSFLMTQLC